MEWKPYTVVWKKQVLRFLEEEEPVSISCAVRVQDAVGSLLGNLTGDESVCVGITQGVVVALVYCGKFGLVHPVFSSKAFTDDRSSLMGRDGSFLGRDSSLLGSGGERLEAMIKRCGASGIAGRISDVALLASICPEPRVRIQYRYMVSKKLPNEYSCSLGSLRSARPDDFAGLLAVEEAYQKEEVLAPIHTFSKTTCEANVRLALAKYKIYVLANGSDIIARAQVNGAGMRYEQIGGVYVWPDFRGQGAGRAVTAALAKDIWTRGKIPCLFVKTSNSAAISLYKELAFADYDDFAIEYY